MVVGGKARRHLARVGQLVVRGGAGAEPDGEGGDAPARHLPHAGRHHAGVHAARQEHAERHVALQPEPHRLAQLVADPLTQLDDVAGQWGGWRGRQRPVPAQRERAAGQRRRVAGR